MIRIAIPTTRPQAVVNYINALALAGARGEAGSAFSPEAYDGLLLPGGWDVNPARYGRERIPEETVDDELDALQFSVLDRFLEAGKPVLGICRGHQLLNVALGGTLIQHLPGAQKHVSLPDGADNRHPVQICGGSFLEELYGPSCTVNSSHHQAVDVPGRGFRTAAVSADGVTEAVEHDNLPLWGVQWHPERMCGSFRREDSADGMAVFRFFLAHCG